MKSTKINVALPQALSVTADGQGVTPTYQWQRSVDGSTNWTDIGNATNSAYTVPVTTGGTVYYHCVVTTLCGSATSKMFTVNVCGNFVEDVEGNWYCTGNFGDAGTWMTMNLRSTRTVQDGVPQTVPEGENATNANAPYYYYPNGDQNILAAHPEYGLLYTWAAANIGTSPTDTDTNPTNRQGICPSGWHLPSIGEWSQLCTLIHAGVTGVYSFSDPYTKGMKMLSRFDIEPNDEYEVLGTSIGLASGGFDALLGINVSGIGYFGGWWSSSTYTFGGGNVARWTSAYYNRGVDYESGAYSESKDSMISVRCKQN
jgi:uncharacterized protein (TIGR02145 family)